MSANFYLISHLIGLVLLVSGLSITLCKEKKSRFGSILLGLSSLLIFVAGFGLIAKLGYSLSSVWIIGKILIWLIVAVSAPIIAKRFPHFKQTVLYLYLILLSVAVCFAVIKPS